MKHLAALIICLITLVPSLAQDAPPVITPDNAAALTLLDSAGSALPTGVQFSPDGRYILATTTDETFAYHTGDLAGAPHVFPFSTFRFDPGGDRIIGGGQRWSLETGLPVDSAGVRFSQPDGQPITIDVTTPEGEMIGIETGITGGFSSAAVNDDYTVLALEVGGDYWQRIHDTTYIYQLSEGRLIAALPQRRDDFPISRLHFTGSRRGEILMIESAATGHMIEGDVTLVRLPQGAVELEYSGAILGDVRFSPDGKFAYELADKLVYGTGSIIDSIPRFDEDDWMTMQFFSVTDAGIAMVSDQSILRMARFQPDGGLSDFVTVALDDGPYRQWSAAGDHVVMNESGAISVWDIASGSPEPRVIEIDSAISGNAIVEFSPDLTRYRHNDGLRYTVRDTATHEPLGDYRGDRVKLSPDWSLVAYWNGGMLVVDDLETGQRREFDLLPGYLGEVADFDAVSGNIVFEADRFTVTNIASAGKDILTSFDEAIYIEDAQFFDSGNCVVSIEYNGVLAFHETNSGVDCGDDGRMIKNYSEAFAVSPQGRYIVGYTVDCYTPYSYVVSYVYPLTGQPTGDLPLLLEYYWGCGRSTFAFPSDESAIYFADGLLWRGQFSEDGSLDQSQNVKRLLRYSNDNIDDEPTEYSNARIVGVFLGPDAQTIAVYIEDSKGADYVQERYIEIFALHDLGPGVLRRDVRPLRTIPDATFATFSPDSRYVVTNNGLYSVGGADEITGIRGTISAFSPDSQTLATYQDGFVTLWRVPQPAETEDFPLAQYEIGGVRELAFSADGTRLFVVRAGEVQTWGVAP